MKEKKNLFSRMNSMIDDEGRLGSFLYGTIIGILAGIAIYHLVIGE